MNKEEVKASFANSSLTEAQKKKVLEDRVDRYNEMLVDKTSYKWTVEKYEGVLVEMTREYHQYANLIS